MSPTSAWYTSARICSQTIYIAGALLDTGPRGGGTAEAAAAAAEEGEVGEEDEDASFAAFATTGGQTAASLYKGRPYRVEKWRIPMPCAAE